jgi:hypothetical protein
MIIILNNGVESKQIQILDCFNQKGFFNLCDCCAVAIEIIDFIFLRLQKIKNEPCV